MSSSLARKYENTSLTEVEVKDIRFLRDMKFESFGELREIARQQQISEDLVDLLEAEVEWMKEKGHSSIIIDPETGMYMLPANEETMFQQIVENEDGTRKLGSVIVNPIILSKVLELKQEKEERKAFLEKHGGTRGALILEVEGFEKFKKDVLEMEFVAGFDKDVEEEGVIVFGEENFTSVNQSYNPRFSRYDSYLASIRKKFEKIGGNLIIKDIYRVMGTKKVYYKIRYGLKKQKQLE